MKELNGKRVGTLLMLLLLVAGLLLVSCSSESEEPESVEPEPTTAPAEPADPDAVTDVVWEWVSVADQPARETTEVPNPENYTLILREDGTFSGKADCNQISGSYTNDSGYSFNLGPSTMAACRPDSMDQQYLELLGSVVAGGPDGIGGFALETAGGQFRMKFRNGGAAPAQ